MNERREKFAQLYARMGNATHAFIALLGEERCKTMKRDSLRAMASSLLNRYDVQNRIEEIKAEMRANGEKLPHYRKSTYRTDLY